MFCGSVVGIPSEIISPKKVAELHPLLNVHDLVGAMHVPEDAVVSSADVALALASAASQNGKWVFLFIFIYLFIYFCCNYHLHGFGKKRLSKRGREHHQLRYGESIFIGIFSFPVLITVLCFLVDPLNIFLRVNFFLLLLFQGATCVLIHRHQIYESPCH